MTHVYVLNIFNIEEPYIEESILTGVLQYRIHLWLKALIAVSLRGDVVPDVGEFVQWLNSQCPEEFVDVEVERVDVERSFASCLTLVLMSMPISI
jgi:hypothetical protein